MENRQCFISAGMLYVEKNFTNHTGLIRIVPTAWTNTVCDGDESTLSDCYYIQKGDVGYQACDHGYDIFISCICKCEIIIIEVIISGVA